MSTLASSPSCTRWPPPISIHSREPFTSVPKAMVNTSSSTAVRPMMYR